MSEAHEALEHAEHAQHAAHGGLDKRIAVSIAMVAAVLATVSMLAHRSHNDVLRLQNEASVKEVNSSNGYAWYQATRGRQLALELNRDTLALQADPATAPQREKLLAAWAAKIEEYKADLKTRLKAAEDDKAAAKALAAESHHKHAQGDRLDLAHLAVELGLVLCSIAILTNRKAFWLSGIAAAAIGIALAGSAFFVGDGHPADGHPVESH